MERYVFINKLFDKGYRLKPCDKDMVFYKKTDAVETIIKLWSDDSVEISRTPLNGEGSFFAFTCLQEITPSGHDFLDCIHFHAPIDFEI